MADNTEELGLEVFVEGWQRFEQILDRLDKNIEGTGKSMEKTGGIAGGAFSVALGNIAASAVNMLADAFMDAGRAVVDFGVDSVKMAADFQSQMAILDIAASSTGLSFDELHDAALQVGGDTSLIGVSAVGAADAMTGLFKAGLSNVEVFGDLDGYMAGTAELGGALRASIDLAAASELDMVQASDLAAVALSAFGGELETEAERSEFINAAMNNMVQAADASVAEVSGLAEALKMVGPTAGAAGISIQDTNNALALLSTRGIQGSMAGTALDGMLRSLRDATPQAADELEKLGVEIFDLDGNMYPLVDIIGQFEGALGDATEAERAAALGTIFTAQGQRAMNTLMAEGAQGWYDMADATANAATIQAQAEARGSTFNAQMESLEGTIETLKIGIGEQFLPVAQELIGWFSEMVEQHGPELQAIFEAVAGVVTQVIQYLMGLLDTGDPLNDFFVSLPEPVQKFVSFMQKDFLPAVDEVWNFVLELVGTVVDWWKENIPLLSEEGNKMIEAWTRIKASFDNIWTIIKAIVETALNTILNVLTLSMQIAQGEWEGAWDTIVQILIDVAAGLITIVENFFEVIANLMGTSMEEIRATWAANWGMFKTIVITVFNNIKTAITNKIAEIKDSISGAFSNIRTLLTNQVDEFFQIGRNLMGALKEGIMEKAQSIIGAIRDVIQSMISTAKRALQIASPSGVGVDIGEQFDAGIVKGLANLAPKIQTQMQAVVQAPAMALSGGAAPAVNNYTTNNFNLTTQSMTPQGGLALEFGTMAFATR